MPIPLPIAGGLIDAGSHIVDAAAQGLTNRANRKWSEKMYAKQRADALADFNMQNAYNTPSAQMKRLKEAGLNPNLVYGTGAATSNATPVRSSSVTQGNAKAPQLGLGSSIAQYIQLKQMDSEIDLRKTQQMVNLVEAVLKGKQSENVEAGTQVQKVEAATKRFDLGLKSDLRDVSLQAAAADLNKKLADTQFTVDANARANMLFAPELSKAILEIAKLKVDTAKSQEEINEIRARVNNILSDTRIKNLDADLKEKGIQPHDSAIMRALENLFTGTQGGKFNPNAFQDAIDEVTRKVKEMKRK